jgi:hypothetical protein
MDAGPASGHASMAARSRTFAEMNVSRMMLP